MGAVLVIAGLIVLATLFTPGTPVETVVVLPGPEGKAGTVVVQRGDERVVLDQPYAANRTGADQVRVTFLTVAEVRRAFGTALDALPARPASFALHFVTATDELTEESKAELQKVLATLKRRPVPDVIVIGHTDTVGDAATNDRLSAQRAERVKGFLVDIGIAAERIRTAGRGERELLVPSADNVDEPRNRRVEINVR